MTRLQRHRFNGKTVITTHLGSGHVPAADYGIQGGPKSKPRIIIKWYYKPSLRLDCFINFREHNYYIIVLMF